METAEGVLGRVRPPLVRTRMDFLVFRLTGREYVMLKIEFHAR